MRKPIAAFVVAAVVSFLNSVGVLAANMTDHGGPVQAQQDFYIDWWGPWGYANDGSGYSGASLQTYLRDLINWGVAAPTYGYPSSPTYMQTLMNQYFRGSTFLAYRLGEWSDGTLPVNPSAITVSDLNKAAIRTWNYFRPDCPLPCSSSASAYNILIFIAQPWQNDPSTSMAAHCAIGCPPAGSSEIFPTFGYVMTKMWLQPQVGDAYGHGHYDYESWATTHEIAEAATDSLQTGWYDSSLGSFQGEIGDLCARNPLTVLNANASSGGLWWRVTPLWSNAVSGCAMS
jgi:hypothetical protein